MKNIGSLFLLALLLACQKPAEMKELNHPEKSWVFWYWMQAGVSKEGITADLEAMQAAGLGGAYLMPIKGPTEPPLYEPVSNQLSPEWWEMVRFSMEEAKRLGLELGIHASDGFALAGGPWITPELSMQKVVWSETFVKGGQIFNDTLVVPDHYEDYYQDIAVYAFPVKEEPKSSFTTQPKVTTSTGENADFLIVKGNEDQYRCNEDCWFQYSFDEPFTCQSIQVITKGNNYQSHRLLVEASDDGESFRPVFQMEPPRHGWQDTDAQVTYAIPKTTAKYFRFQWKKEGTEPGAEDLDAAKWSPRLKIAGLELSNQSKIHQYEGKSGAVWRVSPRTTSDQLPVEASIAQSEMINITDKLDEKGKLNWDVPEGNWIILRMGHTSTGHTNYTGGGGLGLECDKFNPEAINTQFDGWYGNILDKMGKELTQDVLKVFHIDSWECGSQNWSPVFRKEFTTRRGYDPLPYLPIMAGYPINDATFSEKFLHDIRETITELTIDNFYSIMANRAHEHGMLFSAESVAPTMVSDGMRHYGEVDFPMGEFWLRSPTHDKPNDMLDAISGAHVYGKNIIQAEGFTELRMAWDEHPGMLKTLLDRNYALGINRLFFHVFTHNPWTERKPGMTLDGVGLYFQRDQTWWDAGAEFVAYTERCQRLLQEGKPVVDIAVFTGEGLPRRAILPDRLVETLPGIFGKEAVQNERLRLQNEGQPQREMPAGVTHSANMADPEDWLDPLNGYKYDSFNKDALLRLAQLENGKIQLATGATYEILVLPQPRKMDPNPEYMSVEVLEKLVELVEAGARLLIGQRPMATPGLDSLDSQISTLSEKIWGGRFRNLTDPLGNEVKIKQLGKGIVIRSPYLATDLSSLEIYPDLTAQDAEGEKAENITWTHRRNGQKDIYFVSNQSAERRIINLSLKSFGKMPKIYDPVSDQTMQATEWYFLRGQTHLPVRLEGNGSLFVILEDSTAQVSSKGNNWIEPQTALTLEENWTVTFDPEFGGPSEPIQMDELESWKAFGDPKIRYYSGTAVYETTFDFEPGDQKAWLGIKGLHNIASVTLNGTACGVAWTPPYQVDVSTALKSGKNELSIAVTNSWRNRLIGDHLLPEKERITQTTAPYRLKGQPLLDAGILESVSILTTQE